MTKIYFLTLLLYDSSAAVKQASKNMSAAILTDL